MAAPVPNQPTVDYPHQSIVLDTILVETTSNKLGTYLPIEPGAPFKKGTHTAKELADFADAEMLGQKATADNEWMQRYWGRIPSTQDIANWEESYGEESNSHPAFQRRYLEKRDSYTPRTKLTALPGLYRINVTGAVTVFTTPPAISFSGGTGSGATAIAVLTNAGLLSKIVIKSEGTYTVVPTVVIAGGAGGDTAVASIQPATCVLTKEVTGEAPFPYDSLYILVTRLYETLPGPVLAGETRSQEVRGRIVVPTEQRVVAGTVATSGSLVISSVVVPETSVVSVKRESTVASLPPDESWAFWDFVPLPLLLFSITNTIFCNNSEFASLVTNPVTTGGSSVLRKHRVTVSYSAAYPNPDLSGSSFTTRDIRYQGKMISFSYNNVLNDAITYSQALGVSSGGASCTWTEAYTFSASTPSATTFAAGAWYVRDFKVETWGTTGFRAVKTEFYSAAANPSI